MSAVPNPVPFPVISFPRLGIVVIPLPLPSLFLFLTIPFLSFLAFFLAFFCFVVFAIINPQIPFDRSWILQIL